MVHYCSVPQCRGKWRKGGEHLRFHAFPRNENMRKLWQASIQRTHPPSQSSKVCSRHFKENDYIEAASGYKYLMKSAVPSLNLPTRNSAPCSSLSQTLSPFSMDNCNNVEVLLVDVDFMEMDVKQEIKCSPGGNVSFNSEEGSLVPNCTRPIGLPLISCDSMMTDELNYFTGLSKICFEKFLSILTLEPFTLPACELAANNQLFLTLCKMKHNFSFDYLSVVSKITPGDAIIVFSCWTYTMFRVLKSMCIMSRKAETELLSSISIGIVRIKVLPYFNSCAEELSSITRLPKFLKGIVAVDECKLSLYYCSKLYDESTNIDVLLEESNLKKSLNVESCIVVSETLLLSNYFENNKVKPVQVSNCVCGKNLMTQSQASKVAMSSYSFQCLVEMFQILRDGIPPKLTIMQSEIFFNCMLMLNLREDLFMSS